MFLGLSLSGCRKSEDDYQAEHSEELTWFSDLSWWSPGNWDADPKSGTGEITEKTGVEIRYLIPEDNGDTRLSLMMINGNMPDILSVSDEQMIRHLITSDAVWNLDAVIAAISAGFSFAGGLSEGSEDSSYGTGRWLVRSERRYT